MFAKFSPDGGRVAYVRANDLWVEDIAHGQGHAPDVRRRRPRSSTARPTGSTRRSSTSATGSAGARTARTSRYWHFDTAHVGDFSLINDTDTTYPVVTKIPYPKAGTTNSAARIDVVSAAGGTPRGIALPGDPRETLRPPHGVGRGPDGDRAPADEPAPEHQRRLARGSGDRPGRARCFRDEDKAWVDVVDAWQWLPGNPSCSGSASATAGATRAAIPRDAGTARLLTPGDFDILTVEGVDEKAGYLYFIASPDDATRRYLYRARLDGKGAAERVTPANQPRDARLQDLARRALRDPHATRPPTGRRSSTSCSLPAHKSVRDARGQRGARRRRSRR